MKKFGMMILVMMLILGLMTACDDNSGVQLNFSFDSNGSYTGFDNLPDTYSEEEAENDGCFIRYGLETKTNQKLWDSFVKTVDKDKAASIRMAYFSDDLYYPYITDIFYVDDYYYLFDQTAETKYKQPFKYLLSLKGKFGSPVRDSGVIILTDDDSLTFDIIMKSMYSSDMNYINSVSKYRLVMFQ